MRGIKRRISLILVFSLIVSSCLTGCGKKDKKAVSGEDAAIQNIEQTTEKITAVVSTEEYAAMTQEQKVEVVTETLTELAKEEIIDPESITYDEGSGVVSYSYSDGGLGGVATTEFESITEKEAEEIGVEIETAVDISAGDVSGSDVSGSDVSGSDVSGSDVSGGEPSVTEDFRQAVLDTDFDETSSFPEYIEEVPFLLPGTDVSADETNVIVMDETESDTLYTDPSKINMLVLHGFEPNRDRTYRYLESTFNNYRDADVNAVVDFTVKVEDMLELPNFDVVLFSMHGSYMYDKNWRNTPVLCLLDDEVTNERLAEVYDYYARGDIGIFYSASGEVFFVIFPSFFTNNFTSDEFQYTYVFSECCDFYGWCDKDSCDYPNGVFCSNLRSDFGSALTQVGCPFVSGFHNSVMASYSLNLQTQYIKMLLRGVDPVSGYIACVGEYGMTDWDYRSGSAYASNPCAYPQIAGARYEDVFERRPVEAVNTVGIYNSLLVDISEYPYYYIDNKGYVQIKPEVIPYFDRVGGDEWRPAPLGTAPNITDPLYNGRLTYFVKTDETEVSPDEYFNYYYEMILEDETDWDADVYWFGDAVLLTMIKYYPEYDLYSGIVVYRDTTKSNLFTHALRYIGNDLPTDEDFESVIKMVD